MKHLVPIMAVFTISLGACATQPARFYTLNAQTPRESVRAPASTTIAVDQVTVPDMVDRPQFVLRTGTAQVRIDEYARWAAPLKEQVASVVVANLAQSFPGALVSTSENFGGSTNIFHISVEVQSFESVPGDTATIVVLWTVRASRSGATSSGRAFEQERVATQNYDDLVDAHSRALASISAEIADAIRSEMTP